MSDLQLHEGKEPKRKRSPRARRRDLDFYETPAWMVDILVSLKCQVSPAASSSSSMVMAEPCVGKGNIVRAIQKRYPDVHWQTNDLDPLMPADTHLDARSEEPYQAGPGAEWVITNPPFNQAARIVPRALGNAPCVVMLLRITWLEAVEDREDFLDLHPPDSMIVMKRWRFSQTRGQDSAPVAWMLWGVNLRKPIISVPGHGGKGRQRFELP